MMLGKRVHQTFSKGAIDEAVQSAGEQFPILWA